MDRIAAQLFIIRGIDPKWRQLGYSDGRLLANPPEDAGDTIRTGGGSIEDRHAGDARRVEF